MKKIVIVLLCLILFLQNSVDCFAADMAIGDIQIQETNVGVTEEKKLDEEQEKETLTEIETEKETNSGIKQEIGEPKSSEEQKSEEGLMSEKVLDEDHNNMDEKHQEETSEFFEGEKKEEVQSLSGEQVENGDIVQNNDDPQYGRENGYLDEGFGGILSYFNEEENEYIHNSKFANYTINEVIDVSRYQGNIDWIKVKNSGIDYAIIRAGFRGYGASGSLNTDINFRANIEQAVAAGLEVGVYFFSQAITQEEASDEAIYVLDLIDGYDIKLPVVIDYEYASSSEGLTGRLYDANLTKEKATKICKQFCDVVENAGYSAMVYANKDMLENRLDASDIAREYKIWLANYTTCTTYEGDYEYWQYTQNATVSGITGKVDKSFWYIKEESTDNPSSTEIIYNGENYSSVFDFKYYIENNADIKQSFGNDEKKILEHFVNYGMSEGRQAKEDFNVYIYKNRYPDLTTVYGNDLKQYYMHFIRYGEKEGRSGSGASMVVGSATIYNGVDYSSVYDFSYYVAKNKDIKKAYGDDEKKVLEHFVNYGMSEGRQGIESFNVYTYKNRYPDLRTVYGNNLKQYYVHFIQYGKKEGRSGAGTSELIKPVTQYNGVDYSKVYSFACYVEKNKDIKKAFGNDDVAVLEHFVNYGMSEGRQGIESFNVYTYKNRYPDLRTVYGNNLKQYYMHFIQYGSIEGRNGSGTSEVIFPLTKYNGVDYSLVYDFNYYIKAYADIKQAYGYDEKKVIEHFVKYGMSEGRQGNADFNVYVYRNRYPDLRAAYGDNLKQYYMHYLHYGKSEGRDAENIGKIVSCAVVSGSREKMTIRLNIALEKNVDNFNEYYIAEIDSYSASIEKILISKEGTQGVASLDIVITGKENVNAALMDEFALAVKDANGNLILASESVSISNPEAVASNTSPIFKGTSKKGLQGIAYASYEGGSDIADARNANTKQTLLNLDLASVVSQSPKSGYVAYTYKGKTYYFSALNDLKSNIQSLNYGYKQYLYGNDGRTPVAVTLCLLLSYNAENSYLIDPAARTPGHSYYMLNVREENARETLEALFLYLGETFGQGYCYVSNWILGNEINSSRAWNYSGGMDFDTYVDCYATAFRMLYNGVKAEKIGNTVCISLDNGWNAAPDTYAGKAVLDTFAKDIHAKGPNIDWSIAYHAYSYPLTRADFWNDYGNTTDSLSTPYISMRNISVLTNYAGTLESMYGRKAGSIRVLLTEQGYSYSAGADNQAMAIVRGYYIAEFNDRIDAFIIRAILDDPDEASGNLYFGLMNRRQEKRTAFYVYEFMDSDLNKFRSTSAAEVVTPENYGKFNRAKEIVCNTNWSAVIPGFSASKLAGIK